VKSYQLENRVVVRGGCFTYCSSVVWLFFKTFAAHKGVI